MKLQTPVLPGKQPFEISLDDRVLLLGSCFADEIGGRMSAGGLTVCANPFGTLYNPLSILRSLERLQDGRPFDEGECVRLGAGMELTGSFWHHTSFARPDAGEFLKVANEALEQACSFWRGCDTVVVTLGTAWVWERDGQVVANCLKRDAKEFVHRRLTVEETLSALRSVARLCAGKRLIWTVSPVRHLWDGAHSNQVSKATLLLALDWLLEGTGGECGVYFPAYEIVLDELRDYRFFADDMTHPTALAVGCVWERFCDAFIPESDREAMSRAVKASRAAAHRPLFGKGD